MGSETKRDFFKGVYYTAIAKYAGMIISLFIVAILSRLISPKDFGLVAIATVLIQFLGNFTDMGIESAIIQHKKLTKRDLSNIFSFTFWIGIIITVIFFFAAWPISSYYENKTLLRICQILSVNLFFSTISIVPGALLCKEKLFKFIAYRTLVVQITVGVISVIAALSGLGLYSLIISPVLSSIILFVINYRKNPQKLYFSFGLESIRQIFSYSLYQFLFGLINYFSRNMDKLIVGKYLGLTSLGFYEKSYRLMMLPLQNISHVIGPVMHPIFSEFHNDLKKLVSSYEKVVRFLAVIGFPLSVLLYFTAKELTLIIFGPSWLPSVRVFEVLAISVGTQIILSTSGSIFQATNSTKLLFLSGLLNTLLTVSGMFFAIFVFKTIEAVGWSMTITFITSFILSYLIMYLYLFKRNMFSFIKQLIPGLTLSIVLIIVNILFLKLSSIESLLLSLIAKTTITSIIFILYIQLSGEYNLYEKAKSLYKKFR